LKHRDLLENVLIDIERGIREGVNSDTLAKKYSLSEGHLRRLFKTAFKMTMPGYIRSRRLKASLIDLVKKDSNILGIALDYGFYYEQSYIRAFKREFGITPGELRKAENASLFARVLNAQDIKFFLVQANTAQHEPVALQAFD